MTETTSRNHMMAIRVLRVLLGLAFLIIGTAKLTGSLHTVQTFEAFGWGQWFRYASGMLTDAEAEELGLNDESTECAAAGISFVNVPIPDRSVPSDTNAFLRSVEQLATRVREGRYVAVHCRASIGRSSVLAACILVRLGWDAKTAFDAIEGARGRSVPDTSEQKQWVISNVPTVR